MFSSDILLGWVIAGLRASDRLSSSLELRLRALSAGCGKGPDRIGGSSGILRPTDWKKYPNGLVARGLCYKKRQESSRRAAVGGRSTNVWYFPSSRARARVARVAQSRVLLSGCRTKAR